MPLPGPRPRGDPGAAGLEAADRDRRRLAEPGPARRTACSSTWSALGYDVRPRQPDRRRGRRAALLPDPAARRSTRPARSTSSTCSGSRRRAPTHAREAVEVGAGVPLAAARDREPRGRRDRARGRARGRDEPLPRRRGDARLTLAVPRRELRPVPDGRSNDWWTSLPRERPRQLAEVWIAGRASRLRRRREGRARGGAWTSASGRTAGGSRTSSAAGSSAVAEAIAGVRAGVPRVPAREPAARRVPRGALRQRLRLGRRERLRRRLPPADTASNHYQDISVRRVMAELARRPGVARGHPDRTRRGRPPGLRHGPTRAGAARVRLPRRRPAPDPRARLARASCSAPPSCRSTTRRSSPRSRTGGSGTTSRAAATSPSRRSGR